MKAYSRWQPVIAILVCVISLCSCQDKAQMKATATVPVETQTPRPTTTPTPVATYTLPATTTVGAPVQVVRVPPLVLPAGLAVEEYLLKAEPVAEGSLYFTYGNPFLLRAKERAKTFPSPYCAEDDLKMCISLGAHSLVAEEIVSSDGSSGNVILNQDGVEIYWIASGPGSPINALRGLWVYGGHWAMEAARITETRQANSIIDDAVGRIIVDGQILNDSLGYEEAFGFQTLNGRPFYFFKRNGKIGASYDGVEIPLAYNQVPHYGCCSAGTLNPHQYQDMLDFLAEKDGNWYYVEISVFGQP